MKMPSMSLPSMVKTFLCGFRFVYDWIWSTANLLKKNLLEHAYLQNLTDIFKVAFYLIEDESRFQKDFFCKIG